MKTEEIVHMFAECFTMQTILLCFHDYYFQMLKKTQRQIQVYGLCFLPGLRVKSAGVSDPRQAPHVDAY